MGFAYGTFGAEKEFLRASGAEAWSKRGVGNRIVLKGIFEVEGDSLDRLVVPYDSDQCCIFWFRILDGLENW